MNTTETCSGPSMGKAPGREAQKGLSSYCPPVWGEVPRGAHRGDHHNLRSSALRHIVRRSAGHGSSGSELSVKKILSAD